MTGQDLKECIAEVKHSAIPEQSKEKIINTLQDSRWIPCSERLPDVAGYEVLATLENNYGQRRCAIAFMGYGDFKWYCNNKEIDLDFWKVIAWRPLPEPYKESD